jgi:hypothetical protein
MHFIKRVRARMKPDIRQAIDGLSLFFAVTLFFALLASAHLVERIRDFLQHHVS